MFHWLLSENKNGESLSQQSFLMWTHRTVSILSSHLRAGELHVRHLAALVEWLLVGVPAGLGVPLVVAFSPGQF